MSAPTFIVAVDSREQTPFNFDSWPTASATLATGDYSIVGLEDRIAIERKSLSDLLGCIGHGRQRFKRELHRLQAYTCRAVVIEAELSDIIAGNYRSKITPAAALGSIASWHSRYGVPFIFAGPHGAAYTLALLRNHHRQLKETIAALNPPATTSTP